MFNYLQPTHLDYQLIIKTHYRSSFQVLFTVKSLKFLKKTHCFQFEKPQLDSYIMATSQMLSFFFYLIKIQFL